MGLDMSRDAYKADLDRYAREIQEYKDQGLGEDHPLVKLRRRRMAVVVRMLERLP